MKSFPKFPPLAYLQRKKDHQRRTLYFADGKSVSAHVLALAADGIFIGSFQNVVFIEASKLCTADRVYYGFGTRKEIEWAARIKAMESKRKSAGLIPAIAH